MWKQYIELLPSEEESGVTAQQKADWIELQHESGNCIPLLCPACMYEEMPFDKWQEIE